MPITEAVYNIVYNECDPKEIAKELMIRNV